MKEKRGLILNALSRFSHIRPSEKEKTDLGSILESSVEEFASSRNGGRKQELQDPYSSKHAFTIAGNIKTRAGSEKGLEDIAQALKEHHVNVVGDVPPHLEGIPGVVVFDGARPRNEAELNEVLENNVELKKLVNNLQEKGKNVWAEADAHKGVILTVAAIAAGVVGAGVYLHHKKEQNEVKASGIIFKKKK